MWQMSGGTCAALLSPPVESNANPVFLHALVTGRELQLATQPPPHHLLQLQHLQHHPRPQRNGVMRAMGSGNVAGHAFLTCVSRTPTLGPIGRKTSGKFFYSTRRRRRTNTFGPVWNCGRTSRQWCFRLMVLGDAKPGMLRRDFPPTWQRILLPDGELCEGSDGDRCCSCKQSSHPWKQGPTTIPAPSHP